MLSELRKKFPAETPAEQAPALECGHSETWLDRFGRSHCRTCQPPSSPSLVAAGPNPAPTALPEPAADYDPVWGDDSEWREYTDPSGNVRYERRGKVTREMRLAWACLDRQERELELDKP